VNETEHQNFIAWPLAAWFLFEFAYSAGRLWHYLLPCALFFVLAAMPGRRYQDQYTWILGACLVLDGILDHLFLVRWMPGVPAPT
jgi:hypothetical protein